MEFNCFSLQFFTVCMNVNMNRVGQNLIGILKIVKNKNTIRATKNASKKCQKPYDYHTNFIDNLPIKSLINEAQKQNYSKKCPYWIKNINYQNQHIYIQNNYSFGLFNSLQSLMTSNNHNQSAYSVSKQQFMVSKYINNRKQLKQENLTKIQKIIVKFTPAQIGQGNWDISDISNEPFWYILNSQNKAYSQSKQFTCLLYLSNQIIIRHFNKTLPKTIKQLKIYAQRFYISNLKDIQKIDHQQELLWAISFLLYKSGRYEQFKTNTPQQISRYYLQAEQYLKQYKIPPKKFIRNNNQKHISIFEQLLQYMLIGNFHIKEQIINKDSLDYIFVLLRSIGVYGKTQYIKDIRQQIYEYYLTKTMKKHHIYNLLYLVGYYELAMIGPNTFMDDMDYLLYLIFIINSALFNTIKNSHKSTIINKLLPETVRKILQYKVLTQNKSNITYYILLLLQQQLLQISIHIIHEQSILQIIDWQLIQNRLNKSRFKQFIRELYKFFTINNQNGIIYIEQFYQTFKNSQDTLLLLLNMYAYTQYKVSESQIVKLSNTILMKAQQNQENYKQIFQILQQISYLQHINNKRLHTWKSTNKFSQMGSQLDHNFTFASIVIKLVTQDCLPLFYKYIIKSIDLVNNCDIRHFLNQSQFATILKSIQLVMDYLRRICPQTVQQPHQKYIKIVYRKIQDIYKSHANNKF